MICSPRCNFFNDTKLNYLYCSLNGKQFELHVDVEYEGSSGATHEMDISLIDNSHTTPSRQGSRNPRYASLIIECKFFSSSVPSIGPARALVGLLSDFQTKMKQENSKVIIMKTPESIESEHTELHHQLEMATNLPSQTGVYAKEVARVLHPHFVKEEEFALPPLALLPELAKGNVIDEMKKYIPLCDALKKDWPALLEEHAQIEHKPDLLQKVAVAEKHDAVVRVAENLKLHAETEEEIHIRLSVISH